MRILVDKIPNVKENCPFHRMVVYINDVCRMKNYCTLSGKQCTWDKKLGYRPTCDCLKEIAE